MTQIEFVNEFLLTFAKNLSEKEKTKFHIGNKQKDYLWNIFAGNLIPCLKGNAARAEYDKVSKLGAVEIHFSGGKLGLDDLNTSILDPRHQFARDIDNDGECEYYVIGQNFSWCYVVTHEFDLCGPYFCYKPN